VVLQEDLGVTLGSSKDARRMETHPMWPRHEKLILVGKAQSAWVKGIACASRHLVEADGEILVRNTISREMTSQKLSRDGQLEGVWLSERQCKPGSECVT